MNETRNVKVKHPDGTIIDCFVEIFKTRPAKLIFSGPYLDRREFLADDLFDALVALRGELEDMGAQLLCAGARPDVFPSGMSREMGLGIKAYVNRIGFPSRRADLVDIFDCAAAGVGSVAEQNAFHKKWLESLKQR